MRLIVTTLLVTATAGFAWWKISATRDNTSADISAEPPFGSVELILELERYNDPDYGFSMAVPAGWTRIVAAQPERVAADIVFEELEPGYAVGFESPRSGDHDRFADYILIELLPGNESGLFDTTGMHQRGVFHSEQGSFTYDRLDIDSAIDDAIDVDLVIFQRGVQAFGYTLAFYAIGEPGNERLLFDAFQIMLRTFQQNDDPFLII